MNDIIVITSRREIGPRDLVVNNHTMTIQAQGCTGQFSTGGNIVLSSGSGAIINATITKCIGNTLYLKENKCQPTNTAAIPVNMSGKLTIQSRPTHPRNAHLAKLKLS